MAIAEHIHTSETGSQREALSGTTQVCADCGSIYQSPVVMPINKIQEIPGAEVFDKFKAIEPAALIQKIHEAAGGNLKEIDGLNIASPTKFFLSQTDPFEFRGLVETIFDKIAADKNLAKLLSSEAVVGHFNADLVEEFIKARKSGIKEDSGIEFDLTHQVFLLKDRIFPRQGDKGQYATLEDRTNNLGLTSRYLSRILSNPQGLDNPRTSEARKEILSYLLPNMLAVLDDPEFIKQHGSASYTYAKNKLAAIILDSLGAEKTTTALSQESYVPKVFGETDGFVVAVPKPMKAEAYEANSINVNFSRPDGEQVGQIEYLGQKWNFKGAHFHTKTPEHDVHSKNGNWKNKFHGEVHLVFENQKEAGGYTVLGAPIALSPTNKENPAVADALKSYKQNDGAVSPEQKMMSFLELIPEFNASDKVSYMGGLTTTLGAEAPDPDHPYSPPGSVRFCLSKERALEVSKEQLEQLHEILEMGDKANSRGPQPLYGRLLGETKVRPAAVIQQ